MHVTSGKLFLACIALALWFGWSVFRAGDREVAVLQTIEVNGLDLYTSLWVVDDAEFVWIRANRPDRIWLSHLRENPKVQLRRRRRSRSYRAVVFDDPEARAHVAARFREKYGLADRWREWSHGFDTIPIRLEPR